MRKKTKKTKKTRNEMRWETRNKTKKTKTRKIDHTKNARVLQIKKYGHPKNLAQLFAPSFLFFRRASLGDFFPLKTPHIFSQKKITKN